jgi:predicted GTPase
MNQVKVILDLQIYFVIKYYHVLFFFFLFKNNNKKKTFKRFLNNVIRKKAFAVK